jgi:hypothetical protein
MTEIEKAEQAVMDEYIEMLLSKKNVLEDDVLGIDCLDSPVKDLMLEVKGSTKVPFEILRVVNGIVQPGCVYLTPAKYFLLKDSVSIQQYWIPTAKIRQLLFDHAQRSIVRDTANGESFLVFLDKQLLLDNAE